MREGKPRTFLDDRRQSGVARELRPVHSLVGLFRRDGQGRLRRVVAGDALEQVRGELA